VALVSASTLPMSQYESIAMLGTRKTDLTRKESCIAPSTADTNQTLSAVDGTIAGV
jgi:hypothetical protein